MPDILECHSKEYEMRIGAHEISVASAPGRIHFLGEQGLAGRRLLVSQAIDRTFTVAVSLRNDGMFRFYSADSEERKRITYAHLRPRREDRWANFIKAAIAVFMDIPSLDEAQSEPLPESGGLSFTISGNIPKHKGFGSTSALELAAALALRPLFKPNMTDNELVTQLSAAHKAFFDKEHETSDFLVMMTAEDRAWTIVNEERKAEGLSAARTIATPFDGYKTFVFDSRVPVFESAHEAEKRSSQLWHGLETLARRKSGITFQSPEAVDLLGAERDIPEETRRRCLHVAEEAVRIRDLETAMTAGDLPAISKLFQHSHVSLRDLFEVSCPEVDWLVKRASETPGAAASRMIGPGFGGSTFALMTPAAEKAYKEKLEDYERIFGFHPQKHEIKTGTAARHTGCY
jgi:galactokinase